MKSITAGLLIGLGGIMYLTIGRIAGAIFFSIGLLTILHFELNLFTGKAGLLADLGIHTARLGLIWIGNLLGTFIMAGLYSLTGRVPIAKLAAAINQIRITNLWYQNIILGILCGIFMYIAVKMYSTKPWVTVMCVAGFILTGANHCIADMFYLFLGGVTWDVLLALLCTTAGNIIGTNIIPMSQKSPYQF